jgi:hypothetical protein
VHGPEFGLAAQTQVQYVALSYCWGTGGESYTLTKETLAFLTAGVSSSAFPRTIRDAVHATHCLGLEWLWVDSMCNVQDVEEDWKREAATMADVYRNCVVELAALGAAGNSDGVFARRYLLTYHHCRLFTIHGEGLSITSKKFRHTGEMTDDWPLYKRGWVFQERVLPAQRSNLGRSSLGSFGK